MTVVWTGRRHVVESASRICARQNYSNEPTAHGITINHPHPAQRRRRRAGGGGGSIIIIIIIIHHTSYIIRLPG